MTFSRFVVVTGLSGAGKSQAMKSFEDLGFYCVDNLPPALVGEFVTLALGARTLRVALSLDMRVRGPFGEALAALDALEARGVVYELLYLDADDDALVRRYSETRRRHPSEGRGDLSAAIARERTALEPFRTRATHVWNTSHFTHAKLGARVRAAFASEIADARLAVRVVAFGFKFGVPLDADLVFDVRFLRNPNYEAELKPLCGADPAVADFIEALAETQPFLDRLFDLIDYLLPLYIGEGKSRLTIAIGCTGGRHRSVYCADRLAQHLEPLTSITVTRERRELATV